MFFEILIDVIHDSWFMLPILYIAYCILEVFERKDTSGDDRMFFALQKYGPLFGALFGMIPQCGFSIIAAMLYLQNTITLGTLIAVMAATSDEAIPVLLSNPAMYPHLIKLLVLKFVIAVAVGVFTDRILFPKQKILRFEDMEEEEYDEEEYADDANDGSSCPCCYTQYPLWISAALRSLKIFAFIFITQIVMGLLIEWVGIETLSKFLLSGSILQPLLSALAGFIPNCAITVVLAQLFTNGTLQFGSLLAGLVTNAGLGLLCLINYGISKRNLIKVVSILYITAVLSGMLVILL